MRGVPAFETALLEAADPPLAASLAAWARRKDAFDQSSSADRERSERPHLLSETFLLGGGDHGESIRGRKRWIERLEFELNEREQKSQPNAPLDRSAQHGMADETLYRRPSVEPSGKSVARARTEKNGKKRRTRTGATARSGDAETELRAWRWATGGRSGQ